MSGETEADVSGWTVDTLHRHVEVEIARAREQAETRIAAVEKAAEIAQHEADKRLTAAMDAAEKAVLKAESASEKRFDSVNEFRAQLADQTARFMPRSEVAALIESLGDKLSSHEGRTREALTDLSSRITRREAAIEGAAVTRSSLFGWLGAAVAFVTLVTVLVSVFL